MIKSYLEKNRKSIDRALDRYLPKKTAMPNLIHEAMRYSVLNGGKRIRPILLVESAKSAGRKTGDALLLGCAIELIHAYSLIHDDLPSMDDAATRRGRPSCHIKYGEANAILAGDALLSLAFNVISQIKDKKKIGDIIFEVSRAIGTFGMVGGQAIDLSIKDKANINLPTMEYINILKTGSLIKVSCKIGGIIGSASQKKIKALEAYGEHLGLAFQIVDDILDDDGYAKIVGISAAREEAEDLISVAKKSVDVFGKKAGNLNKIADFILKREN
ncbi:MAG: polyprenyl synthetase family protein [Candidatus Omnitrophica bacterium]|nr:polyprenyl synthetase family protein [Candidatus Omnitrophota bacterium]MBU4488280.1 polyprenyl synthetase family protein [Candidatus Omnitrophota bacterium]MCG2704503.1 polyprenyl synthetase family protein [Candidatus Omnitrophota bacterium]